MTAATKVGSMNSSSVAAGTVTVFLALSAALGLSAERGDGRTVESTNWTLRGAILPDAAASPRVEPERRP